MLKQCRNNFIKFKNDINKYFKSRNINEGDDILQSGFIITYVVTELTEVLYSMCLKRSALYSPLHVITSCLLF